MHSKKCFTRMSISLILMVLLCAGAQLAMCQDSAKTWKDNATGLIWATSDGGADAGWSQANNYCKNLSLDGNRDWRLPTMKELATIFDRNLSKKEFKSKDPIMLSTDNIWGEQASAGEAWIFSFLNGGTSMLPTMGSCSTKARALCVRQPAK